MKTVRIATRQSALALWQANYVKDLIEASSNQVQCEIVGMTTEGDRDKSSPLSEMGGKGVFVKELETALIDGHADIAVHSMKDVPGELPPGLVISAICKRADPRDALVSSDFGSLDELPAGTIVGSSSLRRCHQIAYRFPYLRFKELRGNVDTRLKKLDEGQYGAILLAVAGLERLGLEHRITEKIAVDLCIPAAGQGAIGIESRVDDDEINVLTAAVNDAETRRCVLAERAVTMSLGATCNLPIAAYALIDAGRIRISAFVSDEKGETVIVESHEGSENDSDTLARQLGERLIDRGALSLIADGVHG